LALNTGDGLVMLRPLREDGVPGFRIEQAVLDEYLSMAHRTIAGQAKELGWRRDNVVDLSPTTTWS
jgi:hypothetical protein